MVRLLEFELGQIFMAVRWVGLMVVILYVVVLVAYGAMCLGADGEEGGHGCHR